MRKQKGRLREFSHGDDDDDNADGKHNNNKPAKKMHCGKSGKFRGKKGRKAKKKCIFVLEFQPDFFTSFLEIMKGNETHLFSW